MSGELDLSGKLSLDTSEYDSKLDSSTKKLQGWSEAQQQSAMKMSAMHEEALKINTSMGDLGSKLDGLLSSQLPGFNSSLGTAGQFLGALGPAGLAAGAGVGAAAYAIGSLISSSAEYGSHLVDMSAKTDLSAEALQRLAFAGGQVGVPVESASSAVFKLQNALQNSPEKFEALGLSVSKLRQEAPDKLFEEFAAAVAQIDNPAKRSATAIEFLGRQAKDVMPLLRSNMHELGDEAERLGMVMSTEVAIALDDVDDASTKVSGAWDGLIRNFGASAAEGTNAANTLNLIAEAVGFVSKQMQDHSEVSAGYWRVVTAGITAGWSEILRFKQEWAKAKEEMGLGEGPDVTGKTGSPYAPAPPDMFAKPAASAAAAEMEMKRFEETQKRLTKEAREFEIQETKAVKSMGEHFAKERAEYDKASEARDKYLSAFGPLIEDAAASFNHLETQFWDIGAAQQGAFTTEQISGYLQKLDEVANSQLKVFSSEKDVSELQTDIWDEMTAAGELRKEKLIEEDDVIEVGNGLWMRRRVAIDEGKMAAEEYGEAAVKAFRDEQAALEEAGQHLGEFGDILGRIGVDADSPLMGMVNNAQQGLGEFEKINQISFDELGYSIGNMGDMWKVATGSVTGFLGALNLVITGFSLLKGLVGFIGGLLGTNVEETLKTEEGRREIGDYIAGGGTGYNQGGGGGYYAPGTFGPPGNLPTGPPSGSGAWNNPGGGSNGGVGTTPTGSGMDATTLAGAIAQGMREALIFGGGRV